MWLFNDEYRLYTCFQVPDCLKRTPPSWSIKRRSASSSQETNVPLGTQSLSFINIQPFKTRKYSLITYEYLWLRKLKILGSKLQFFKVQCLKFLKSPETIVFFSFWVENILVLLFYANLLGSKIQNYTATILLDYEAQ